MQNDEFVFAVVGGGLAGLTCTLALAKSGKRVRLIAPLGQSQDGRTTALLDQSINFLKSLDIWQKVAERAFPLKTMRIVDRTQRLVRAPQVDFRAGEIGLEAFGCNIENRVLIEALEEALIELDCVERIDDFCDHAYLGENGSVSNITTKNGEQIEADIYIAADGRNSVMRTSAGIDVRQWQYPQQALVLNFTHTLPHDDTSTEFHTETGPFTVVPLGQGKSSLVWVVDPGQVEDILAHENDDLERIIEEKMHSFLGKLTIEGKIQSFPLSGMIANEFGKQNLILVGETAHVFPPIGAQGFNLGIRDCMEVVHLAGQTIVPLDFGARYHSARFGDVNSRTASVDVFNRSLLSDFLPVQVARSLGLYALGSFAPLRTIAMRQGVSPGVAPGNNNPFSKEGSSSLSSPLDLVKRLIKDNPLLRNREKLSR